MIMSDDNSKLRDASVTQEIPACNAAASQAATKL